jgi:cytidylate kinase
MGGLGAWHSARRRDGGDDAGRVADHPGDAADPGRRPPVHRLRRPEVDAAVSPISAYAGVRRVLTEQQRQIAAGGRIVMVGRDIGTVVAPDADLKLYLEASVEERARRRYLERRVRGEAITYEEVLASMRGRDRIDSERAQAPLRPADDAIIVDTDGLSVEEVMDRVEALIGRDA